MNNYYDSSILKTRLWEVISDADYAKDLSDIGLDDMANDMLQFLDDEEGRNLIREYWVESDRLYPEYHPEED